MKIARFWEKSEVRVASPSGQNYIGSAWGWSSSNKEEALDKARQAANRVAQWIQNKDQVDFEYGLDYPDRPPREEIVREIENDAGETIAIITRNATGALVLSTPSLAFIDVDIPPQSASSALGRSLKRLFRQPVEEPEERVQRAITQAAMRHSQYSFRVYRTAAGFRCILLNATLTPGSAVSSALLDEFGADQLYKKLCLTQECYRARLTPKHWRCEAERPPNRFPWPNAGEEERFRHWQRDYEARSASYAVCRLVEQIGSRRATVELQKLIDLHDEMSGVKSALPLA